MISLDLDKYSDLTDEELQEKAENILEEYRKSATEMMRDGNAFAAEAIYRVGLRRIADLQVEMNLRQWKRLMRYEQTVFEG